MTEANGEAKQLKYPRLSEGDIEELRLKHRKVGTIEWNDHLIVFAKPTRDQIREYRRQLSNEAEKSDALEHLAQATICAFDVEADANKARTYFTNVFLEDYPAFTGSSKVAALLAVLGGLVEEEAAKDLGKGVSVRSAPPNTSPPA